MNTIDSIHSIFVYLYFTEFTKTQWTSHKQVVINLFGIVAMHSLATQWLYGSECWCLTEKLRRRLQTFYRSCVGTMCHITSAHTIRHHIKTSDLLQRLKLHPIDHYIFTRVLRWAGHVSRMDMCRVPRKLITGWVENPRPVGRPQFNFSHTLKKALAHKGLPTGFEEWSKLASDRIGWKNLMNCNSQPLL